MEKGKQLEELGGDRNPSPEVFTRYEKRPDRRSKGDVIRRAVEKGEDVKVIKEKGVQRDYHLNTSFPWVRSIF